MITNKKGQKYHGYKCNYRGGFNIGTFLFTGEASPCRINDALLGPALFVMGLGAAFGAKAAGFFPKWKYKNTLLSVV